MDPFQILDLRDVFELDQALLESAYFTAQRRAHPDQLRSLSLEQKERAVQNSALINHAYETLKDPLKRAQALLQKRGWETPPPPPQPEFLLEIMDLKEAYHQGNEDVKKEVLNRQTTFYHSLQDAFSKHDYSRASSLVGHLHYLKNFEKH